MSHRAGIINALVTKIANDITGARAYDSSPIGVQGYRVDLQGSVAKRVRFHNEVDEFPYVSVSPGPEYREDHPSHFSWGQLTVMLRVLVRNEDASEEELEEIISDLEHFIEFNRELSYTVKQRLSDGTIADLTYETTDITIDSIVTDEGLLAPDGIGEMTLRVRYQILRR